MAKWIYYAVRKGRQPGVYGSWDECEAQVTRFGGAEFKGFKSRQEALDFVRHGSDASISSTAPTEARASRPVASSPAGRYTASAPARVGVDHPSLSSSSSSSSSSSATLQRPPPSGDGSLFSSTPARGTQIIRSLLSAVPASNRVTVNGLTPTQTGGTSIVNLTLSSPSPSVITIPSSPPSPPPSAAPRRPPPPSASQTEDPFSQFRSCTYEPDSSSPFEIEWGRLAASQQWQVGSQVYNEQRVFLMSCELRWHFFPVPQSQDYDEIEELQGFQAMCRAVRKPAGDTIDQCERALRETLVNIVDLIDVGRTRKAVKVWTDFDCFVDYTLSEGKTFSAKVAEQDPLLKCFLRHLNGSRRGKGRRRRKRSRSPGPGSDSQEHEGKRIRLNDRLEA